MHSQYRRTCFAGSASHGERPFAAAWGSQIGWTFMLVAVVRPFVCNAVDEDVDSVEWCRSAGVLYDGVYVVARVLRRLTAWQM
ncbi:hypothetical protein [Nonomuraea sp. NPDC049695]|uniref:hypothetical protein n=1 Tax=Nonomuraea sp. NPDC049695 TaxID=3154734 RepID=UPI003414AD47